MTAELKTVAYLRNVKVIDNGGAEYLERRVVPKELPGAFAVVTLSSAQEAIDKREERIAELERQLRAETFRADTNDKFLNDHFEASTAKGVEIQNLKAYIAKMTKEVAETIEQMRKRDVSVEQRARAEAAEARASALQALLDEVGEVIEPFAGYVVPDPDPNSVSGERFGTKPDLKAFRAARSLAAKIKEAKG